MNWLSTNVIMRAFAMTVGLLFLSFAALSYEPEERSLQARIEKWWIELDERRKSSLAWATLFIQIVAKLTNSGLDRVFGKKLLSFRVIATSIVLSCASLFLAALVLSSITKVDHGAQIIQFKLFARLCCFVAIPALADSPNLPWKPYLPRFIKFLWWLAYGYVLLVVLGILIIVASSGSKGIEALVFLTKGSVAVLVASLIFDIVFIFFTRKILRSASNLKSARQLILTLVYQLALFAALLILPIYFSKKVFPHFPSISAILIFAVALNSIDILITLVAVLVAILFILHRLAWPFIQRPVYAVQRFQLAKQKMWLWSFGITLIGTGVIGIPDWLKRLVEKMIH